MRTRVDLTILSGMPTVTFNDQGSARFRSRGVTLGLTEKSLSSCFRFRFATAGQYLFRGHFHRFLELQFFVFVKQNSLLLWNRYMSNTPVTAFSP